MICEECLMFTHCRYDMEDIGHPCEHFKDKNSFIKVIRCRDCLLCKPTAADGIVSCIRKSEYKKPTDFCSYGENRGAL